MEDRSWKSGSQGKRGVLTFKNVTRKLGSGLLGFIPKLRVGFYNTGLFKSHHLDSPVISVGNLTVGGTGKTPFVAHLAKILLKYDKKPVILSRGYKGEAESSNLVVTEGNEILSTPRECGDEPYLLARKLPGSTIIVGKNRLASSGLVSASRATERVFILDDGYQHLKLKRDINFAILDGTNPFGGSALFPFGQLREPFSSVNRADAVIITRSHQMETPIELIENRVRRFNPTCPLFSFGQTLQFMVSPFCEKRIPIQALSGKSVVVLAGIGNPQQFVKDLAYAGLRINKQFLYRDHHPYDQRDIDTVIDTCRVMNIEAIVTTEKDLIRLESLKLPADLVWAAQLVIEEDPPLALEKWLMNELEIVDKAQ